MKKLTTEEFIKKAKAIHGDKFDYSVVDYINNRTKVKILCSQHGVFEQKPANHLFGKGAQFAQKKNPSTIDIKINQQLFIISR